MYHSCLFVLLGWAVMIYELFNVRKLCLAVDSSQLVTLYSACSTNCSCDRITAVGCGQIKLHGKFATNEMRTAVPVHSRFTHVFQARFWG